jgi:hypothetical protein
MIEVILYYSRSGDICVKYTQTDRVSFRMFADCLVDAYLCAGHLAQFDFSNVSIEQTMKEDMVKAHISVSPKVYVFSKEG